MRLTAAISHEGEWYVACCLEVEVAMSTRPARTIRIASDGRRANGSSVTRANAWRGSTAIGAGLGHGPSGSWSGTGWSRRSSRSRSAGTASPACSALRYQNDAFSAIEPVRIRPSR